MSKRKYRTTSPAFRLKSAQEEMRLRMEARQAFIRSQRARHAAMARKLQAAGWGKVGGVLVPKPMVDVYAFIDKIVDGTAG